jgi:AAHS family 4-hydroxybenzoate transporter-like MFS transporter
VAAIIGKVRLVPALTVGFVVAAVCVALIGQVGSTLGLMFVVVFLAGWGILGGQNLLNALAGSYYPTYLRSTGMGWCLGIGRFGAIVGPLFAGELIRRNMPQSQLFMIAGSLVLTATIVILIIGALMKPTKTESAPQKEVLAH